MKLIYSLARKSNELHSEFIYNMFFISMRMAKDLGYKIVLYGTYDAIERLSNLCDEVVNIDWFEYKMHDDIKVHIWETRTDDYCTIDGDLFLHNRIFIEDTNKLYVERTDNILTDEARQALILFNEYNPTKIVSEWQYNENSCNTGLVRWGNDLNFKNIYIEKYWKFRDWYLENQYNMKDKHWLLSYKESVPSHFICENLLYQLLNYHQIDFNDFYDNSNNLYTHWVGPDKFTDGKRKLVIDTLLFEIKKNPSKYVKDIYIDLQNKGLPNVFNFK